MTTPAILKPASSVLAPAERGEAGFSVPTAVSRAGPARRAVSYRIVLVIGTLAVAATVALATSAAPGAAADASFVRMMRVMAMIKAVLTAIAAAALWWRLARPVTALFAAGYLLGAWFMVGATVLIWQLSSIGAAAVLFHAGELSLLFLAWRDRRS